MSYFNKASKFTSFKKAIVFSLIFVAGGSIASAQNFTGNLKTLIDDLTNNVIGAAGTLFMALAVVAFFFGMAQFIYASRDADTTKMKNGKQFMIWGIISLFVIFSIYGIIRFAQTNLGIQGSSDIEIPTIRIRGSGSNNNNNNNNNICATVGEGGSCTTSSGGSGSCQSGVCVSSSGSNNSQCTGRPYGYPCLVEDEGIEGICSGGICTTSDPGLE